MNIVGVCRPDDWVDTHLLRWRWLLQRSVSDLKCYLIIQYGLDDVAKVRSMVDKVGHAFNGIRLIADRTSHVKGFSVFTDCIRAGMTAAFGITEALYMDIDTDVLSDLSVIPEFGSEDILWTPNSVSRDSVTRALDAYGITPSPPYVEPAVIYLRRSFEAEYRRIASDNKLDLNDYLPGVNIWNVVVRQHASARMLPYAYNTAYWDLMNPSHADPIHIVHYGGSRGKEMQPHLDVTRGVDHIMYNRSAQWAPIDWSDITCVEKNSTG